MKTEDLLKLVSDSFGPKAESIDVESFHLYFENRPYILAKIKESKHQFLAGRRGTGKTTFLKYLDLATLASAPGDRTSLPAIGFYINLGTFAIPNIGLLTPEFASAIFSKWLPLKCTASILDGLEKGVKGKLFEIRGDSLDVIVHTMIGENKQKGTFAELKDNVGHLIQHLESLCSRQNFDLEELNETIKSPLRDIPLESFLNEVASQISLMLEDKYKNVPGAFFLLDRYDELPNYLQDFTKVLIHWGTPQEYYLKIGVTSTDNLQLKGVPHRDYRIVHVEFPPTPEGEKEYHDFATRVLERRLHAISQSIEKMDPSDAIASALLDINKLLPASKDRQNLVIYTGVEVLERLSARNISIFLDYVSAILREAISNPTECDLLRSTKSIPFDLQHKAIKGEATGRLEQEFPTQVGIAAKKLHTFLVNKLHPEEGEPSTGFIFTGEVGSEANQIVHDALEQLNSVNVITRIPALNLPHTYELSQFFLPQSDRILSTQGTKEIPVSEARNYITGEPRKTKARKEEQQELFEEKPVCFFPTGFRNPWENKVRSLLQEPIFAEVGLEYKDGAMYHPDSNEIGECVKRLMQEVDFFVVEFSTFNENVAFEVGLATAIGRPTYAIRNRKVKNKDIEVEPSAEFRELIEGYKQQSYEFEYGDKDLQIPAKEEYVKSLERAVRFFSNVFKGLPKNKRRDMNPFDSSQPLLPAKPPIPQAFIYHPSNSRFATWLVDIEKKLREEKIEDPYPYRADRFKGREQIIMGRLKAICRCKHCVIDTTGKDQYGCLLLGFAMAINGPEILHVYDKENPGLFTNWKGWRHYPYDSKQELWDLIKEFIQST